MRDMRRGSQPGAEALQRPGINTDPISTTPMTEVRKPEYNSSIGMDDTTVGPSIHE